MDTIVLRGFFMWCSIINMGLMLLSFVMITVGRTWAYRVHAKLFSISEEQFDLSIYWFMGIYKLLTFVFCIVPYVALEIVTR